MKAIFKWRGKRKASFGASSSEATLAMGEPRKAYFLNPLCLQHSGVALFVSHSLQEGQMPKCSWPTTVLLLIIF